VPTDALDCHSSGGPRNHLSEIGGADPLRRERPEITSPRSGDAGSSTTTVLRPSSGAASKSSSPDRGVPTPSGGASKSSSLKPGVPGGLYHTRGGALARNSRSAANKFHHSITSSAWASSKTGMLRPRALAVLRLITSSTLVLCWIGRSAGLAPLRIFPM